MLNLNTYEDIAVIHLSGELGMPEIERVKETVFSLIRKRHYKLVLDFEAVDHVHYLSVQPLVEVLARMKSFRSELKFAGMSDYTRTIFKFGGAQGAIENFATVSEAVLAFRPNWRTWH